MLERASFFPLLSYLSLSLLIPSGTKIGLEILHQVIIMLDDPSFNLLLIPGIVIVKEEKGGGEGERKKSWSVSLYPSS